jgi:hypothetical protein
MRPDAASGLLPREDTNIVTKDMHIVFLGYISKVIRETLIVAELQSASEERREPEVEINAQLRKMFTNGVAQPSSLCNQQFTRTGAV